MHENQPQAVEGYIPRNQRDYTFKDLPDDVKTGIKELVLQSVVNWPSEQPYDFIPKKTGVSDIDVIMAQRDLRDEGWIMVGTKTPYELLISSES